MTWRDYSDLFGALGQKLRAEWKCAVPSFDTLPSEELDRAVSIWCGVLAKNLQDWIEQPPEIVRPWVIVRVLSAQALSRQLARQGNTDAPALDQKTLRQLLISEWHGALRDRWALGFEPDNEQS